MNLATFIRENLEQILVEWEAFARTLEPAGGTMSDLALRDHARQILTAVALDMDTAQTHREQQDKSHGLAPDGRDSAAAVHGNLRQDVGFNLVQLVAEFRALRASVLRLWSARIGEPSSAAFDDMTRFNEAIDQAVTESVTSYSGELGRARDTFIAILGHDLRSPLSAIAMSAHNLASNQLAEEQRERAVETIQRSALTMKVMIRDLLDYAGSRLGKGMPMRPERADLEQVCGVALNELMAAHPERAFELEQEGDLTGKFDRVRIGEVLSNLLNNALIHGDSTQPIRMAAEGSAQELRVHVKNAGALSDDVLRLIFDPQSAARSGARSGASGLGLGLYISREIAQAHGGAIEARSSSGETVFTLRLPRALDA